MDQSEFAASGHIRANIANGPFKFLLLEICSVRNILDVPSLRIPLLSV